MHLFSTRTSFLSAVFAVGFKGKHDLVNQYLNWAVLVNSLHAINGMFHLWISLSLSTYSELKRYKSSSEVNTLRTGDADLRF